ncbi:MAG: serine hydrolase domain-containing protein [Bacteroidota bacterium]
MKIYISVFTLLCAMVWGCQPQLEPMASPTTCASFYDNLSQHPRAAQYQQILDRNRERNMVGATLLIKDRDGVWVGKSGSADLAAQRSMQSCDRMMIASISKPFTSVVIFKLIEAGLLSLDTPIREVIAADVREKVPNAEEVEIHHLLTHRSGIPDYYNLSFLLDQLNVDRNRHSQEALMEIYVYGKKADFAPGETYAYSNSNFVLLGMIAERVSGQSLQELYEGYIFQPLGLESAYYDPVTPLPDDMSKGYTDLYGNGDVVESMFLYGDETSTGDGGIVMNAHDLLRFFEALFSGNLISDASFQQLTSLFTLPENEQDREYLGQLQNGYGIEHFEVDGKAAFGHTGAVFGYLSMAFYYPEDDFAFIQLTNTASYEFEPRVDMFREAFELMWE